MISLMRPRIVGVFLLLALLPIFVSSGASAESFPRILSYQGLLLDERGGPLDGPVSVVFSLYKSPTNPVASWTETHPDLDVRDGLFTVLLGSITPLDVSFFSPYYLGVKVGEDAEMTPRHALTASPHALTATLAEAVLPLESLEVGDSVLVVSGGRVGIGTDKPNDELEIEGALRISAPSEICANCKGRIEHTGSGGLVIDSDTGGGTWADMVFQTNGTTRMFLTSTGRLGIGTEAPRSRLEVVGALSLAAVAATCDASATDCWGSLKHYGSGGLVVNSEAAVAAWADMSFKTNGTTRMHLTSGGRLGIGTVAPRDEMEIAGALRVASPPESCAASATACWGSIEHAGSGGMVFNSRTGGGWADMSFKTNGTTRMHLTSGGRLGIGTVTPSAELTVKGKLHVLSKADDSVVVEIGEGLDYAEGFDVVSSADSIVPGAVLVIDEVNPGRLRLSDSAYDTKVAGIVAGASGLGSGVRLGVGRFDHDVALAGRVYCNVDAMEHEVHPGDLLTTSDLPGFAMKASDGQRRQGAILGKAMQGLPKGERGQVLVLVTLQ